MKGSSMHPERTSSPLSASAIAASFRWLLPSVYAIGSFGVVIHGQLAVEVPHRMGLLSSPTTTLAVLQVLLVLLAATFEGVAINTRRCIAPESSNEERWTGWRRFLLDYLGSLGWLVTLMLVGLPFQLAGVLLGHIDILGLLGLWVWLPMLAAVSLSVSVAVTSKKQGVLAALVLALLAQLALNLVPLVLYYAVLGGASPDHPLRELVQMTSPVSSLLLFVLRGGDKEANLWLLHITAMTGVVVVSLGTAWLRKRGGEGKAVSLY